MVAPACQMERGEIERRRDAVNQETFTVAVDVVSEQSQGKSKERGDATALWNS